MSQEEEPTLHPKIERLTALLAGKVSLNPTDLETHGRDEGYREQRSPIAVVYAGSVADVQAALAWARRERVPVIPFGAGTSIEGALIPQGPALSLDLTRMNRVLDVRTEDFVAVVEPGVTRVGLNEAVRNTGLFFPVDPGADATLGGMAATNASGTTTVRYGGMRQNVLALQVVLASGEVLDLGRAVRKTSSGYDLKDIFVGSEGTLGVITRLTVRLHPIPEYVHTLRVFFSSLDAAAEAAYAIMGSALPVARLEILDESALGVVNRYLGRSYPQRPALFLEFHSSTKEAIAGESALAADLCRGAGATDVEAARTQEEREAQWEARHQTYRAFLTSHPGCHFMTTDSAVPFSRLTEFVRRTQDVMSGMQLEGSILGHVGDGNVHTVVAVAPEEYARAEAFAEALVRLTLDLGGTITGEHGIGLRKRKYLEWEHGPAVEWMRRLKSLFDPDNNLNPGKVV